MKYLVDWLPDAEQELADLWLNAADRSVITQAAYSIDQRLQDDPETAGESRPNDRRILFGPPRGVIFRVHQDSRRVEVHHVWRF
jgi:hypothetical protein